MKILGFLLAALVFAPSVHAAPSAAKFVVELRVIEGTSGDNKNQVVDPRLASFEKDLKSLPFKELKLIDSHTTTVREGERISLEIPGGKAKRFLQVAAHGKQASGKLRFQLTIDALKFDTLVAVPNGGTMLVAVPKAKGPAMLFAFTARAQ